MSDSETGHLAILLATYNEADNLPTLIEELRMALPAADIVVIDDDSPDGTGKWCDQRAQADRRLFCLHRVGQRGLGSAVIHGMNWALQREYQYLATMDADWSHAPRDLVKLVECISSHSSAQPADGRAAASSSTVGARAGHQWDVAVGSRYVPGGKVENWPWHRRAASRLVNQLARLLLRLPTFDNSGALRVYRTSVLKRIELDGIRSTGYSYLEELLYLLHRQGARIVEIPITFRQRRAGSSKAGVREAVRVVANLITLPWHRGSKTSTDPRGTTQSSEQGR